LTEALSYRITAKYGTNTVLHDVEGSIAEREIAALVGLSGSGKSTLALSLLRLLQYRKGEVTGSIKVAGRELTALSEKQMREVRGKLIGYVPQNPSSALNDRLKVKTLLGETWKAHSTESPGFDQLLHDVQLPADEAFLNKKAGELSTGQGQRLLIALALMHNPPVILADEPTSALDAITQSAILKLFAELNQKHGTAMLFISHDLLSVASLAHRVQILHEGRIVETGSPESIFGAPQHPFTQQLVAAMPGISKKF
jgi:peptide/nickel transport system ATP-binding protein